MASPVVLELGSHSLKVHYQTPHDGLFQDVRFPWSLGHEVYQSGKLSGETLGQAVDVLGNLLRQGFERKAFFAIATGALRDAAESEQLRLKLSSLLGIEVRVLTGREEASLLAEGYLKRQQKLPALLADIGGGTLELVSLSQERTILRDSLPLGAVRLHQMGNEEGKPWNLAVVETWIRGCFDEAMVLSADEVHATGGTVRAVGKLLGKESCSLAELVELIERIERDGPPAALDAPRQLVLLPGLLVLRRLLTHAGARVLTYTKISVGRTFLERTLNQLSGRARSDRDEILKNMRLTNVYYPEKD